MLRRLTALLLVFLLVGFDAVGFRHPAAAAGTVTISAWTCPPTVDAQSPDAAAFATACTYQASNSTFALTAAGVTRRRATTPGKPASWPAVSGPFKVEIDDGTGQQSVVFCKRGNGSVGRVDVVNGTFAGDLTNEPGLACDWYLIPGGAPPPPEPTATATLAPTPTPRAPVATVPPTATPRPTATQTGGGAESSPAATPGELPPLPETIYPPAMYRANPQRTGEQPGPGPTGDPALLWRYPIGDRPVSSPVLSGGTIYIGGDAGLLAVYAASGTERWRFPTERPVVSSPSIVNGLVYFGSQDGLFACLDAQTGIERWRFQAGGMILSSPLVVEGSVYFTSYDGNLYSLNAETGEVQWQHLFDASEFIPSPAYYEGTVVVGTGDIDGGYLYGIDARSGEELWRHQVAGAIGTTPAVVDGIAYFGSDDGYMYAYNMETQKRVFRVPTGKLIRSSPAVFGGVVYVGNRLGSLYAFDAESGDRLWEFESGDWVDSPPSFVGDVIYVGTKHRKLYVLRSEDGSIIWEYQMGSSITTSPIVVDSIVYFAARDGFLYAVGGTESSKEALQAASGEPRPAKVPEEVIVEDGRYLFDRVLPLDLDGLKAVAKMGTMTVYASETPTEAGAVYIQIEDRVEKGEEPDLFLARYLPEHAGDSSARCLAEGPRNAAAITSGTTKYAFAGVEPDLVVDAMSEVASTSQLGSIYAESPDPPFTSLYVQSPGEVQRYVLLDENGLPEYLRGIVPFGGRIYAFAEDMTGKIASSDLVRVGCAGPFAIEIESGNADGPHTRVIAVVNERLLAFDEIELPRPDSGD